MTLGLLRENTRRESTIEIGNGFALPNWLKVRLITCLLKMTFFM